jgi:hypothetical protein
VEAEEADRQAVQQVAAVAVHVLREVVEDRRSSNRKHEQQDIGT